MDMMPGRGGEGGNTACTAHTPTKTTKPTPDKRVLYFFDPNARSEAFGKIYERVRSNYG